MLYNGKIKVDCRDLRVIQVHKAHRGRKARLDLRVSKAHKVNKDRRGLKGILVKLVLLGQQARKVLRVIQEQLDLLVPKVP
jgi:hypothetical protein